MESYIIDFIVTSDVVRIVELNPFSETTGACLFDWKKDKKVIEEGSLPHGTLNLPPCVLCCVHLLMLIRTLCLASEYLIYQASGRPDDALETSD